MSEFNPKHTKKYQQAVKNRDWQTCDLIYEEFNFLKEIIDKLEAENKKLRECVEFYDQVHRLNYCVDLDKVEAFARKTLKKIKEGEK